MTDRQTPTEVQHQHELSAKAKQTGTQLDWYYRILSRHNGWSTTFSANNLKGLSDLSTDENSTLNPQITELTYAYFKVSEVLPFLEKAGNLPQIADKLSPFFKGIINPRQRTILRHLMLAEAWGEEDILNMENLKVKHNYFGTDKNLSAIITGYFAELVDNVMTPEKLQEIEQSFGSAFASEGGIPHWLSLQNLSERLITDDHNKNIHLTAPKSSKLLNKIINDEYTRFMEFDKVKIRGQELQTENSSLLRRLRRIL